MPRKAKGFVVLATVEHTEYGYSRGDVIYTEGYHRPALVVSGAQTRAHVLTEGAAMREVAQSFATCQNSICVARGGFGGRLGGDIAVQLC